MTNYIKKNFNKILIFFILVQPILDLITGICVNVFHINITLGIIIRILFLLFLMFTTIFIYKRKFSLYIYLTLFIYSCFYLFGITIYKDGVIFLELQGLLKAIYFPIILASLYDLKSEFELDQMVLFKTLFIYILLILIPNALGLGFESYKITKTGNLGFFNAANEISGIISILTPIMFIKLKEIKNIFVKVLLPILYLIVILTIGTKTPLLTLLITIGFTYLYYVVYFIKNRTYKPLIITGIFIVTALSSLILILPNTNFYKNIKVHLEYLEVDHIKDVFKDEKLIDHFIFSQRLTFLKNKKTAYNKATPYEKLFGIGYTQQKVQTKLIEMDYFDIYYSQGAIGFIIILGIYLYILYNTLTTKKKLDYANYMVKLSTALVLLLSLLTGHIITAPAVSLIAALIILENKKNNLIKPRKRGVQHA